MDIQQTKKFIASLQEYTYEEVRDNSASNWIIIQDLVYDLTNFMDLHPGGSDILMEYMGLDATSVFEDVGHSNMARTVMLKYVIGRVIPYSNGRRQSQAKFFRRDSAAAMQNTDAMKTMANQASIISS